MSDRKLSRSDIITRLPIKTIADLRDAIAANPVLGPRQKEAQRSAAHTFCKWLGKEPENMPADYRAAMYELARLNPVLCGVSKGRFANVRSLLNRALLALRADLLDTRKIPLFPEWESLFADIGEPFLKRACGRFARWCSTSGLLPSKVDQAVADRYAADLAERMFTARPRQAYVSMCRAWNAARRLPVWPQVHLDPGDRRRIYALTSAEINAAFRADLEHMLVCFSSRLDLVDGFSKPYEPKTIEELRRILQRLYTVAITHHQPAPTITSLADLVRIDVARSILEFYLHRFGQDNMKSAAKYAHFLYIVAKYWVRDVSDDHLKVLQTHRTTLKPQASGMTDKNRAMLRLFEDETRVDRLLSQGEDALAAFNRIDRLSQRDALALQHAFAIELLIAAPVRPQNLASISLSRHLVWGRDGTRETVHLIFPASEVKNDIDLEFRLPPRVIEMLKVYLAKARRRLVDNGNDYLFPGQGPRHKGPGLLSQQIAETTQEVLGVRVTGHRFRHLVGFLYLKDNPGGHEVVRRFLGHKRIETTIASYAGMEQAAAIAHVDRFIEERRQRIVQGRSKRSPKARPGGPRRT